MATSPSPLAVPAVLLVEDSPDDAKLIVDALAHVIPRHRIGISADGADALDFILCRGKHAGRDPQELPMFVLLDLNLPHVTGLEVLREIRNYPATRLLPVTVLSASERPEDVRRAAELGANSFVRKPDDGRQLKELLSQIALYWLELNIPPPLPHRR